MEIVLDHGPVCLRNLQCHVVSDVEIILIGRDILKNLAVDPLTLPDSRRATREIKEIESPCMLPSADAPENEEKFELDDDFPIADRLSKTELDTGLNIMIAGAAKGFEKISQPSNCLS